MVQTVAERKINAIILRKKVMIFAQLNQLNQLNIKNLLILSILFVMLVHNTYADPVCPEGQSTVDCIQKRCEKKETCKIIAGIKYDAKPFGYQDEKGVVRGFDVDIVKAFAKCWLNDENAVEFVRVTSKDRIRMLQERQVDIIAATMTYTPERNQLIDFSQTYFFDGQRLLINKKSDVRLNIGVNEPFNSFAKKLDNKKIAAAKGSTSIANLKRKAKEFRVNVQIIPFRSYNDAVNALKSGQVDIVTTDGGILSGFVKDGSNLKVVGKSFSEEPYGIGVYKGDKAFRKLVDNTLQALMESGEYNRISRKWFSDEWPLYEIEISSEKRDFSPFECPWLKNY